MAPMSGFRSPLTPRATSGLTVALTLLALLAGCSRDAADREAIPGASPPAYLTASTTSPTRDPGDEPFCAFVGAIDNAGRAAGPSQEERTAVLRTFRPRFAQAIADAPPELKPYVRTMVDASESAIRSGTSGSVNPDDLDEAARRVDSYCGVSSAPK